MPTSLPEPLESGVASDLRSLELGTSGPQHGPGEQGALASRSYRQALRATAITGFTNFTTLAVSLVKSKVIAVRVGPEGIGLFGVLTAATGLISSLVGFGITSSGVRQVASASAAQDPRAIARVVYTLRRTSLLSGLLGTVAVLLCAEPIARLTTGSDQYAWLLRLLAPLLLFTSVNGGQIALLRGLRRISELARLRIFGAVVGTALAVPLVWVWGLHGIAPAMLMASSVGLAASWWYARQVRVPVQRLSWPEVAGEAAALFSLGAAFLLTGLQGPIVQNALRATLVHFTDLATVGQFLAAFALSHTYVKFVLDAMGLDYLPRLAQKKDDPAEINRLVNEQTEIALLAAVPGVTALVVLAPLVIPLLYSSRFDQAIEVFRWQCLGVLLKVASWPLGYVLIAQARRTAFVITESVTNLVYVGAFYVLVRAAGLTGAALSFAVLYLWYLPLILLTVRSYSGFRWSTGARCTLLAGLAAYALALAAQAHLVGPWQLAVEALLVAGVGVWSYRELCRRLDMPIVAQLWEKTQHLFSRKRGSAIEP
jgi:PST family polysaccharide transporter